jgi:hypothetical protein
MTADERTAARWRSSSTTRCVITISSGSDEGTLSLVLRGTDYSCSVRIVDRLSRLETHQFATPIQIALGAACYPMHAMGPSAQALGPGAPIACCRGARRRTPTRSTRGTEVTMRLTLRKLTFAVVAALATALPHARGRP